MWKWNPNFIYFSVSEYNENCDKDELKTTSTMNQPLLCDLDVIDEYLKISRQLLSPSVPQTDRSDKSRVAPEGGNAEWRVLVYYM